jgi:hypothetical protein
MSHFIELIPHLKKGHPVLYYIRKHGKSCRDLHIVVNTSIRNSEHVTARATMFLEIQYITQ